MGFVARLALGVGLSILSYLFRPRPEPPKPPSIDDAPKPTVEAGKPIGKVWGSMTIKDVNHLWWGDAKIRKREAVTGKK